MNNTISFKLWGRFALFTDPITKIGGEKCSYHIPTCEALKGVARSIYWKPTFIWFIDRVRVMKRITTQAKGVKPLEFSGGNTLALYNYLSDVEYQVEVHFEWNENEPNLASDRVDGKHYEIARRMLERGGRRDIFLGTRECQGYVEPCKFGEGSGAYDDTSEVAFGLMFHSFIYPNESKDEKMYTNLWNAKMANGVVEFPRPEECEMTKLVREMKRRPFEMGINFSGLAEEGL